MTVENSKLHLSLMVLQLMRLRRTLAKAKVTTRENISNGVVTIIVIVPIFCGLVSKSHFKITDE
jgi:hypothetical protein